MPIRYALPVLSLLVAHLQTIDAQHPAPMTMSLESLSRRSWSELECLYRNGVTEPLPDGYYKGKAVYCREKPLWRARTGVTRMLWKGKHITGCRILNQWAGVKTLDGEVGVHPGWLDGKPSVTLDYRSTSRMWRNVRDEIRKVGPGLYVGIMFEEKNCEHVLRSYFILEAQCCQDCQAK